MVTIVPATDTAVAAIVAAMTGVRVTGGHVERLSKQNVATVTVGLQTVGLAKKVMFMARHA